MQGWSRVRQGRGFRYLDEAGEPLSPDDVERCRALVIPPAWTDVWICPVANGHLQAVGTDDAGRRQYLYHPDWRVKRDAEKFAHMEQFARRLLRQRPVVRRDLSDEPTRLAVSAAAFSLLDLGVFRIGSDRYMDENGSFGLATIEKRHVQLDGHRVAFLYQAKSGQEVDVTVRDPRVALLLEHLLRRRSGGDTLLAYREGQRWQNLRADDVNAYIKATLGGGCSAKDFRTWRGTVIAAHALAFPNVTIPVAMREVGEHLGNTATVARNSYVDPRVLDLFEQGITVVPGNRRIAPGAPVNRTLERRVLRLLSRS
jgi:DNA topoisomerase IB